MSFKFNMPVSLFVEQDAVIHHAEEFGRWGRRCLIVTGASAAKKSGALGDVTEALEKNGVEWKLFDEIGQNPLVSVCHKAGQAAAEFGADFIVGIGGGSPLDAAKAAAVFAANPDIGAEEIYSGWEKTALPLLLVGTTAGTGSEVTPYSVLTVDSTGQKKSFGNQQTYAKVAFGDPSYTVSLPIKFTMSTGLDAVAHALESYYSQNSDSCSDLFAIEALKLLLPALKTTWIDEGLPDMKLRTDLYMGSIYGGLAINRCGTVFCHAMGYYLSEEAGIPHGYACAAFLPELIRYSVPLAPDKSLRLFGALGIYAEELCDTIAMMTDAKFAPVDDKKLNELLERWNGGSGMKRVLGNFDTEKQREIAARVLQK